VHWNNNFVAMCVCSGQSRRLQGYLSTFNLVVHARYIMDVGAIQSIWGEAAPCMLLRRRIAALMHFLHYRDASVRLFAGGSATQSLTLARRSS
jgi:hypothetical protein